MSKFLDTSNDAYNEIAICDRCNLKRRWDQLIPDGNSPGLRVCMPSVKRGCFDVYDPYRLPPRQPDKLTLQWARPDVPLTVPHMPPDDPTPPEPPPNPVPTPPQ